MYRWISREFTTVEYPTNESSLVEIGYEEAVTTNREIVANHLAYTHLYMFLVAEYVLTSNRESGYGRYDVMLEPKDKTKEAFILEFKIHEPEEERSLQETVMVALKQIEDMKYEIDLIARGCKREKIKKYGFAFEGKKVLIGG